MRAIVHNPAGIDISNGRDVLNRAHAPGRIVALDFTKGALVLFMVLYHWLNYFFAREGDVYRYLRFVTPSFIFITGFLVSNVYLAKYGISNAQLPRRLLRRGMKILGLFIVLNVLISVLLRDSYSGKILFDFSMKNLTAIFVTGNVVVAGGKAAAFYILVPISYVLLLSATLVVIARSYKYVFHAAFFCSILWTFVFHFMGLQNANLELVTIGLLGVICGQVPLEKINDIAGHPYSIVFAYCGYLVAITVWNVTYPLLIVGVCLTLMVFFLLGTAGGDSGNVQRHIILVGKYTLFGYIAQIAILQLLYRTLRHAEPGAGVLSLSFGAAFALTMMSVVLLEHARARSTTADRLYKAVFS